ncbi:MAG TPA: type II toxin-antitoxin system VapC family toxin [Myxococcota bacterium]|nr:type II toxin-antitoxin system VapC family toxin [Myxococcota bacterium]
MMRLLLDSHVFIWMHASPDRLSARSRAAIIDADSDLFLSVVVPWELGLKIARKKLALPEPLADFVQSRTQRSRIEVLPVHLRHTVAAVELPAHHADPFDRMLIAQARVEDLTLVTADPWFSSYDVGVLSA